MRRHASIWCAGLLCAVALHAAPASAASEMLVQNVDTSAYPDVSFTIVLPPGSVGVPGGVPEVSIMENGDEIETVSVTSLAEERQPIDVVLLIDTSGSMKGRPLADAKIAAKRFVEAMGPEDQIAVVGFSSEPRVMLDFTSDRGQLVSVIDQLSAAGETALYDGLVRSASLAGASPATERYIVALSDGGDTMSISTADAAARALKDSRTPVYAVALESPEYSPATLETIARVSGGRSTSVKDSGSLASIYQSIAEEMQQRYRVTYRSTRPNTPQLELVVSALRGDRTLQATAVTANPVFEAGTFAVPEPLVPRAPDPAMLALALSAVFVCAVVLVVALGLIFRRDRAAMEQLRYYDQLHSDASVDLPADPTTPRGRLVGLLGSVAEKRGFTGLVQQQLATAGLPLRANEYIFFHLALTIAVGLFVHVLSRRFWLFTLLSVVLAVVVPIVVVRAKAARRRSKLEEQLPGILNLIGGSLRSGWGIQQAIDLVVDEVGDPAHTEFRRVQAESRLGLPLEAALHRMAERVDSDDLRWTVSAIAIQREVGGNLAEVLDTVARTIRERAELRRQVSALTAEGRFSAIVLTVMPFAVFLMLAVVSRDYILLLLTTPVGLAALFVGIVLLLVGTVWMNRVTRVEV